MNQLKVGAVLSYVLLFVSNVSGFLYIPYMLRMLGQSEYGLYSLGASIIAYLTVLDFGFEGTLVRFSSMYRANNNQKQQYSLYGTFLRLYLIVGVLALSIGGVLLFFVEDLFGKTMTLVELDKLKIIISLLCFNLAVSFPLSVFGSIIASYEKFVFQKMVVLLRIILQPCMMVILLYYGYKAVSMVVLMTVLNLICMLINAYFCFSYLRIKICFKDQDRQLIRQVLSFSSVIFIITILDRIFHSTGQLVLGAIVGTVSVAVYSVAVQLKSFYQMFSNGISGVFLPRVTMMVARGCSCQEISQLFLKVGRLQFHVVGPVICGFIIFGKSFISFWAGNGYEMAYPMAVCMMLPFTVSLIQNMGWIIMQAMNLQVKFLVAYIFAAFITLLFSILLSRYYQGMGCALALSMGIIISEFVKNILYRKYFHINISQFWVNILKMSIPMLLVTAGMYVYLCFYPILDMKELVLNIVLFLIVYIPVIYFLSMNSYERNLVKSSWGIIGRLKRK